MEKNEDKDEPLRGESENGVAPSGNDDGVTIYYFESQSSMNVLLAGDVRRNIKRVCATFGVEVVVRDISARIISPDKDLRERVKIFFEELKRVRSLAGGVFDARDFNQVLAAFASNSENTLSDYFAERIKVGPRRREIVARTPNQLEYVRSMRECDVVFGVGPAGTGKTYLAMAMAVSALLEGRCDRIILTRPAVEAGENLGFLPGTLQEKINPYLRPLFDALYDMLDIQETEDLIERNIIEVAPLAFMRGRTLNNAFIVLDEAQNTTNEQMLMFLTRLGFNSRCVVCGDPTQTDLASHKGSGLVTAMRRLRDVEDVAIRVFTSRDVVRHSLVEKIINAWSIADTHTGDGDIK